MAFHLAAPRHRSAVLLAAAVAILAGVGCGKKGPPLPPLQIRPEAAGQLQVRQIGREVVILASITPLGTDGRPLGDGARVDVLRLAATSSLRPGAVSARYLMRQFDREAVTIASLPLQSIPGGRGGRRLRVVDSEAVRGELQGQRRQYLYTVMVADAEGRRSRLPPPILIQVVDPPAPPRGLAAEVTEGQVHLSWSAEATETTAALYNLYRVTAGDPNDPERPLNRGPIDEPSFVDTTFRYGETYDYFVRRLVAAGAPFRESSDSAVVRVRPVDRFPPAPPLGLAATAEGDVIRLYWFPSAEPDLAGYRIYRSEAPGATPQLLGEAGPSETSFADTAAVRGVRYHYSVSAIDDASPPNESAQSEKQSEMLPSNAGPPPAPPEPPSAKTAPEERPE